MQEEKIQNKFKKIFIIALAFWLVLSTSTVTVLAWSKPAMRAVLLMGLGVIILWIGITGGLLFLFRKKIKNLVLNVKLDWKVKFFLFSLLLILVEELITTLMTNMAHLFGVKIGEAYITASTNYLDVIFMHSVIAIAPMFIAWIFILNKYDFSSFEVFLLFGITGTIAECSYSGWDHLTEFGFWIFVYGIMLYLPAYSLPKRENLKKPAWWLYPVTVFLPFLFIPLSFVFFIILKITKHPDIHFPSITG